MRRFLLVGWFVLLASWVAMAQEGGVRFVVNGNECVSNECNLDMSRYDASRPLELFLTGGSCPGAPLELRASFHATRGEEPAGVVLEYDGRIVDPVSTPFRLAEGIAPRLWQPRNPLRLHLGDLGATTYTSLFLTVRNARSRTVVASLRINLVGLNPNRNPILAPREHNMQAIRQMTIPIFPNPVKTGDIHVDLSKIPYGRQGKVSVIDILGATVFSRDFTGGELTQCPTDNLRKGIYFVRIEVEGTVLYTGRVIVDK